MGALFFVLFYSAVAGVCGIAIGAALFTSFVSRPSDTRLAAALPALKGVLAESALRRNEERNNLVSIEKELSLAKEHRRQVAKQIEQYRQSRVYRLRKLAARDWKAMRGGELEEFLEEVFSELQYAVGRTGKAGDQGVDPMPLRFFPQEAAASLCF